MGSYSLVLHRKPLEAKVFSVSSDLLNSESVKVAISQLHNGLHASSCAHVNIHRLVGLPRVANFVLEYSLTITLL